MTKNKKNISFKGLLLFILFILADLIFLYFIKYSNQSLSLNDFKLFNIGNILNLSVFLSLLVGILIIYFHKNLEVDFRPLYTFLIVHQIFLIISFISTILTLPFEEHFYFGKNGNRIFIGLVFSLLQVSLFVLTSYVWLSILKTKSLIVLRSFLNTFLLLLFILTFAFLFIVGKEGLFYDLDLKKTKDNTAVVFGAAVWSNNKPSPSLAARVDKSIKLLDEGLINSVYLTGGNAPGEMAESEVAFNYIETKRNNTKNIFKELNSTSTNEQIQYIKLNLMSDNSKKNIIAISDSYHLVRILEISKFHNIEILAVPSELKLSFENALYFKVREAIALTIFWFFAL